MSQNSLDQIKQTEAEAEKIVENAKQKIQNLISQANKNGQSNVDNAQNQVSPQIEEIIEKAKKEIQRIKTQGEHDLAKELDKLNRIDGKTVEQAAKIVVDSIVK